MKKRIKIFIWMSLLNVYDLISTYIMTPDLSLEGNWIVRELNGGWIGLIADCFFWQCLYTVPIFYALNKPIQSNTMNTKKIAFSICKSVFAGYLLMKFLIGTDNLLSTYCSSYLKKHATLNSQVGNYFNWTIDSNCPCWTSVKGRIVHIYAFILPSTKQIAINLLTGILVFVKSYRFYKYS
jgi:hypothetical protein